MADDDTKLREEMITKVVNAWPIVNESKLSISHLRQLAREEWPQLRAKAAKPQTPGSLAQAIAQVAKNKGVDLSQPHPKLRRMTAKGSLPPYTKAEPQPGPKASAKEKGNAASRSLRLSGRRTTGTGPSMAAKVGRKAPDARQARAKAKARMALAASAAIQWAETEKS